MKPEQLAQLPNSGGESISAAVLHECAHAVVARMLDCPVEKIVVFGNVDDYGLGWTDAYCIILTPNIPRKGRVALGPVAVGDRPSKDDLSVFCDDSYLFDASYRWVSARRKEISEMAWKLYYELYPKLRRGNMRVIDPFDNPRFEAVT